MLIETHPQAFQRDAGASKLMLTGGNGIQWEQLPRQLPHGVEIELHPDPLTGYFPRRISFVRFQTSDAKDGQPATVPIVNIAFAAPRELPNVNEKMFVIDSTDIESVDATDGYLARIEAMEDARWARNGSSKESDPVRK